MKSLFIKTALFVCFLSTVAYGQKAKLEGHVFTEKDVAVSDLRIIAPGGQTAETDSRGHFKIAFPDSIKPGQATRIEIDRPGWVIFEPMLGNCVTQHSERNFQAMKVIIVVKKSPLALSPKRLVQVIAKWADEKVKLRGQVDKLSSQLDEYAFLKEYSEKYGFTLDQFVSAAQQWAQSKESDDKEEQALKEYFLKNYAQAAQLAGESAIAADEELEQTNKQKAEVSLKVIRRFKLQGNSFYAQYKFREAMEAYNEIEKRFSTRKLSKEDLIEEWAEMKILLGVTKHELGTRIEGQESQALLADSIKEYHQALKVYTREQLPQQWAATQNNLGIVLSSQGERTEGAEGARLLAQAVEAYREALKVRTREQLPQQWAVTQNNLADAYFLLQNWIGALESYINVLTLYPDYEKAYSRASTIYHEELFKFEEAFALNQKWVARHPDDIAAQVDFAEKYFTTGRFTECGQSISALLIKPEIPVSVTIALRAIEIADLIALKQADHVSARMEALIAEVTSQPAEFKTTWVFNGTRHFIGQNENLSRYRDWLLQLFDAVASPNRDQIIKGLNEAKASFK